MINLNKYIKELQSVSIDELTEHSKRFALETLFREVAETVVSKNEIKILHEPKRKDNYGSPDFKIYTESSIIGYVENKKIDENLDKVLKSAQIKKYRKLSPNILLTNYLDFIWIKEDSIQRETLCYASDLENKKFKPDKNKIQNVETILTNFFSEAPVGIASAKELALALAVRSKNLKDFLNDDLESQKDIEEKTRLVGLYETFKNYIFNQLTVSEFADAFAQMLVYGLFLAKLNADTKEVTLYNVKRYIPQSFELIRELVGFLDELEEENYKDTRWIIDEVISIMNNLDLPEIQKTLQFSKKVKDNENIETDPYIYFYETFLAAYDKNLRKAKGVYYTPPQVVNFIVRSINEVLKSTFQISNGLANPEKVTVLDFATGTGTFIIEILRQIFETIPAQNKQFKEMLIKDHILKNIYGFEYLIAPYTIAHLKLSQFLKENDYKLDTKERFQLFLTNTLEPIADIPPNLYAKTLSAEGKSAQKVKDKPILVITGNPPYSGHSKNTGDWITNLLKGNDIWAKTKLDYQPNYYEVDGKPLNNRNPKWLQDDYVKFIRFAQYKIDTAGEGVVGIITNHSFLDNPTFIGMRQSLMKSFDQLYFIDLHGNTKKLEKTPEGKPDKNVFDIEQGVAISIFIKKKGLKKGIFHTDFWGSRKHKFDLCLNNSIDSLDFKELKPNKPQYLFIPQNYELKKEYDKFIKLEDIFLVNGVGICSKRDKLVFQDNKEDLLNILNDFKHLSETELRIKYKLSPDSRDWKINNAKENIEELGIKDKYIKEIIYRPFDEKVTYYTNKSRGFLAYPVYQIFKHLLKDNINLIVSKINRQVSTNYFFVSNIPTDLHILDTARDATYNFPLWLYSVSEGIFAEIDNKTNQYVLQEYFKAEQEFIKHKELFTSIKKPTNYQIDTYEEHKATFDILKRKFEKEIKNSVIDNQEKKLNKIIENKSANISPSFLKRLKEKYNREFLPEQVLGYVYAIMQNPAYQNKYKEFFKTTFPKIPLCAENKTFEKLSELGLELIEYQLLNKIPQGAEYKDLGIYSGDGDNIVVKPEHKKVKIDNKIEERLYFNKTQYFNNVPEKVYEFYIGGYQVLNKYLKSRKGKELNMKEVLKIAKIVKVLSFTIKQMKTIDNETNGWI